MTLTHEALKKKKKQITKPHYRGSWSSQWEGVGAGLYIMELEVFTRDSGTHFRVENHCCCPVESSVDLKLKIKWFFNTSGQFSIQNLTALTWYFHHLYHLGTYGSIFGHLFRESTTRENNTHPEWSFTTVRKKPDPKKLQNGAVCISRCSPPLVRTR